MLTSRWARKVTGALIGVDCEAPFGVGAPSVGDMTEFGAVDVNGLRAGRVETFQGTERLITGEIVAPRLEHGL
jgi:hypothetical protein